MADFSELRLRKRAYEKPALHIVMPMCSAGFSYALFSDAARKSRPSFDQSRTDRKPAYKNMRRRNCRRVAKR